MDEPGSVLQNHFNTSNKDFSINCFENIGIRIIISMFISISATTNCTAKKSLQTSKIKLSNYKLVDRKWNDTRNTI